MDARLDYNSSEIVQKFGKSLNSAGMASAQSTLPTATRNLVLIRASQINGCAVCTDMHTKDAEHEGETSVRLNLVATWRDARVFTDAERAALMLTEQGPASPMPPSVSPTGPGRTLRSTTTPTNSPPWFAPSSTRTIA
jgi:AhpD family alkylhydroperoxidase